MQNIEFLLGIFTVTYLAPNMFGYMVHSWPIKVWVRPVFAGAVTLIFHSFM